ncbi:MAG: DUF1275 domain-containing protein [Proteobacteria bacterium]|nr:DUF1275 domain-containing protein [Pseudomonadota bacterium]NDC24344.1 DUF1275 domain-containing protein [Pseudomonadota bacterium]NDD04328.1 DUF1275 domain-containing protein [Pseudomonadota bacterium]NDG26770.1 DUF1275 domain-containing protein [Pseudomonadota bacterium]
MTRAQAFKEITKNENILLWILLAFQAGFINAGGFLACGRFVSHVTGYGTQVGLKFSEGNFWIALEMMLAPVSFIAGASFSAYLIDRPYFRGEGIKIGASLLTQSILLVLIFALGECGFFGDFGEPLVLQRDFELLFALCFVCGLQNATFSCLTNGQIRTTHMTGVSTDLGMNLVRIPCLPVEPEEKRLQKRLNWVRFITLMSFMMGSGIAAVAFPLLGYHGFIVPALSSLVVMLQAYRVMEQFKVTN